MRASAPAAHLQRSASGFRALAWYFLCGIVAPGVPILWLQNAEALAAPPASVGRKQHQEARGWLQLKQDQKTYRDSVEPLAPPEERRLDRLEQRQRDDARQLGRRQRQSLDGARDLRRRAKVERGASQRVEGKIQRQLDRQHLDQRTQRESQRPR